MLKISSILIGATDLNKAKSFYEQVFNFKFEEFRPPFASASFDGMEFNIEENAEYRSSDWAVKNIGGRKNISFETDNLEQFLAKAESLGAIVVQPSKDTAWGWKEAIIADMDGNEFIIEQEI